ncbi:tRNA (adenosine(37)-N6)-threonylcarbamoyltransferase complex dimerization subunit type 1 TsaB, partial [Acidaminococcus sp. CAG:542]|uniref:tRNA (adenosine(37)-N6)-threonylcarbamoyltransferase complex dimerization subunit type 1 TsaB n=1 Tax=Acidaminococcus sp. CAG:542 TaxID=1262687 RepID=UPI00258310B5
MLTLGIDTATRVCSVAVCDGKKILGSLDVNVGLTHSEGLVPQLETLLAMARVKKEDLDLLAVSRGPGSFTGLRIGMATAEAMAYALERPLVAVDALAAIAYKLP